MPIHTSYKSMLKNLRSQYKEGPVKCRPMADGTNFCMSEKAWSIFYATMNKHKKDETETASNLTLSTEEILEVK